MSFSSNSALDECRNERRRLRLPDRVTFRPEAVRQLALHLQRLRMTLVDPFTQAAQESFPKSLDILAAFDARLVLRESLFRGKASKPYIDAALGFIVMGISLGKLPFPVDALAEINDIDVSRRATVCALRVWLWHSEFLCTCLRCD
jgi:hypothetical protein